jgi:hypothetical protein
MKSSIREGCEWKLRRGGIKSYWTRVKVTVDLRWRSRSMMAGKQARQRWSKCRSFGTSRTMALSTNNDIMRGISASTKAIERTTLRQRRLRGTKSRASKTEENAILACRIALGGLGSGESWAGEEMALLGMG